MYRYALALAVLSGILAVGVSPALASRELQEARVLAGRVGVRLVEIEYNDFYGATIKILGAPAALDAALAAASEWAARMHVPCVTRAINNPDNRAWGTIAVGEEYNEILEGRVVCVPFAFAITLRDQFLGTIKLTLCLSIF